MKVDFKFLHVDASEALMDHCHDRLSKIEKFSLKPMEIDFTFSMQGHICVCDVRILEGRRKFKAQGSAEDFYRAVEMTMNKIWRQLSKDKNRIKAHKNPEASTYGKLARLTPELEVDFDRDPLRKVS